MHHQAGLTSDDASARLREHGPNAIPEPRPPGLLQIFLRQYKSPFIYVLLAAAGFSLALGQRVNAVFIFLVLLLNAAIGTFQEYAAQRAATGLRNMVPRRATVVRDGRRQRIDAVELVPGDLLDLESGDRVPADLELRSTTGLQIDESMLTGESESVEKSPRSGAEDEADRSVRLFAGTTVLRGRATAIVTATGALTELGKIAGDVNAGDVARPPLMQRIHEFTMRVTWVMLLLIASIFCIALVRGDDLTTVFFLGVALAVSAIPEGLPVAITVALSIGMRRMAKHGVIIRDLVAVESLGSCTFIASDKTGTLTVNEMTVRKLRLRSDRELLVPGEGSRMDAAAAIEAGDDRQGLERLARAACLANEAEITAQDNRWAGQGDSVDIAFLIMAEKAGIRTQALRERTAQLQEVPYESENAFSASLRQMEDGAVIFAKGSVERIQKMCRETDRDGMQASAEALARQGYRVIALASRRVDDVPENLPDALECMEYLGVAGIMDPLRPEAIDAVRQCREARIDIAMVTGDHPATALVLASELGIARSDGGRAADRPVTGIELEKAHAESEGAVDALVRGARVFARVEPRQKMQIVRSLIRQGQFVAVTGDGVNDAPALKHAHIGVAMGRRGSDVARESADMILTDDNFSSIVEGVRQGRVVYNNIRKVIFLLISTGAAEITLILLSMLFGLPLALLPLQLLWLNLVTNGIQDVALVFEPEEGDELKRPPRQPGEPIFDRLMIERVVINAIVMGVLAFAVFFWQMSQGVGETEARNVTLLLMVLFENVHVLNSRSETKSIFRQYLFGNPLLFFGMLAAQAIHILAMHLPGISGVLQITPVSLQTWAGLLAVALVLIIVDEAHKLLLHRTRPA